MLPVHGVRRRARCRSKEESCQASDAAVAVIHYSAKAFSFVLAIHMSTQAHCMKLCARSSVDF